MKVVTGVKKKVGTVQKTRMRGIKLVARVKKKVRLDRFGNFCKTSTKNLARKIENSIRLQHPFVPIASYTILSARGSTGSYITAGSVGIGQKG